MLVEFAAKTAVTIIRDAARAAAVLIVEFAMKPCTVRNDALLKFRKARVAERRVNDDLFYINVLRARNALDYGF